MSNKYYVKLTRGPENDCVYSIFGKAYELNKINVELSSINEHEFYFNLEGTRDIRAWFCPNFVDMDKPFWLYIMDEDSNIVKSWKYPQELATDPKNPSEALINAVRKVYNEFKQIQMEYRIEHFTE